MKPDKEQARQYAKDILDKNNICYVSLNNDLHWKIGDIDFYPTSGKWIHNKRGKGDDVFGHGILYLLDYTKQKCQPKDLGLIKKLSIEQLFNIASHSKDKSLMGICTSIHKEIYG